MRENGPSTDICFSGVSHIGSIYESVQYRYTPNVLFSLGLVILSFIVTIWPYRPSCLYLLLHTPSIWSSLVRASHVDFTCYCTLPTSGPLLSVSAILPLPVIVHSRHLFFCCQPSCHTSRPRHGFLN